MKHTLATLLLIFLCAPGMAQTKGKPPTTNTGNKVGSTSPNNIRLAPELSSDRTVPISTTLWPVQTTTPQPQVTIGDPAWSKLSSGQITWSTTVADPYNLRLTYSATWLYISRDEVKVGWLIPTCTTANLKRAPKLTAWVIGMQSYSSPQAKWLSALFKACEIQ